MEIAVLSQSRSFCSRLPKNNGHKNSSSANVTSTTPELYDVADNFAPSEIFTKIILAILTSKDAAVNNIKDFILKHEEKCKQVFLYVHRFLRDLHVKSGCVCVDNQIAKHNPTKQFCVEVIYATHLGGCGITLMAMHVWWLYMHRDIVSEAAKCTPCKKKM